MNPKFTFFIFGLLAVAEAQQGYQRENPAERLSYDSGNQRYNEEKEEEISSGNEIPGEADKDYPIFGEIPETRFDCGQQQFPGYYADVETRCQVYHICQIGGRKDSFLCPNGTVFNQEKVVCDWWFNFDCAQAETLYSINEVILRAMEDADRLAEEKKAAEGYRYETPKGSKKEQQQQQMRRPSSPTNVHQSDFDTVVIEADRVAPRIELSQQIQPQGEIYGIPEMARRQEAGAFAEDNRKGSQITGANFGKQIIANARGSDMVQEPGREYLPAQNRADKY